MSRGLPRAVRDQVEKARESALLAVSIYNRPNAHFKTYGYIVMMQIAWTSLLFAIFHRRGVQPFYRKLNSNRYEMINGLRKAWDLSKCIKEFWGGTSSPVAENLRLFIGLRDRIEHRDVPALDMRVFGECQALLFNFEDLILKEFGARFEINETLAPSLQFSRVRSSEAETALRELLKPLPRDISTFIAEFKSALSSDMTDDLGFSYKVFLIPNVKNDQSKDALAIEFVHYDPKAKDQYEKLVTLIKDRQVPILNLDTFKPGAVVTQVKQSLGAQRAFNMASHTACWRHYKVRPPSGAADPGACDTLFCIYDKTHGDHVYTKAWIEHLCKELADDAKYREVTGARP